MTFAERLDHLMTLTGTSNSALGRALSYDPSYISRVRAGKRGLPRRQPFLRPAANYFAQVIVTPIQQSAASALLLSGKAWPKDPDKGAEYIFHWLESSPEDMNEPIGQFFQSLASLSVQPPSGAVPEVPLPTEDAPTFSYGDRGKQASVLHFLAELCAAETPPPLYAVSDEPMEWLLDDPAFSRKWSALLARFLKRGGEITLIHTIDRNLGEILGSLQRWLPLYFNGRILSYYCPRLRDGICRRTLFVAPGLAALTSNSIEGKTGGMVNLYIREPRAVEALAAEFSNYLALCRPLMDIYTTDHNAKVYERLLSLIRGEGPLVYASSLPLPMASDLPSLRPLRTALEEKLAAGDEITELVCLPDPRKTLAGPVFMPLTDLVNLPTHFIAPRKLVTFVREADQREQTVPGYHFVVTRKLPDGITLIARNRQEILLFSSAPPSVAFALTEPRIVSAFWDYLQRAAGPGEQKRSPRRLSAWLREMDRLAPKSAPSPQDKED